MNVAGGGSFVHKQILANRNEKRVHHRVTHINDNTATQVAAAEERTDTKLRYFAHAASMGFKRIVTLQDTTGLKSLEGEARTISRKIKKISEYDDITIESDAEVQRLKNDLTDIKAQIAEIHKLQVGNNRSLEAAALLPPGFNLVKFNPPTKRNADGQLIREDSPTPFTAFANRFTRIDLNNSSAGPSLGVRQFNLFHGNNTDSCVVILVPLRSIHPLARYSLSVSNPPRPPPFFFPVPRISNQPDVSQSTKASPDSPSTSNYTSDANPLKPILGTILVSIVYHLNGRKSYPMLLILLSIFLLPQASAGDPTLTILSLNTNRLINSGNTKVADVISVILSKLPSIFILTETPALDGPHIDLFRALRHLYEFFTTPNQSQANSTRGGITIGVVNTVPAKLVPFESGTLVQHILQVSIRTPDYPGSDTLTPTLIIGIYAPQLSDERLQNYWQLVLEAASKASNRWILAGDYNILLRSTESTPNHSLRHHCDGGRNFYRPFLNSTSSSDLWLLQEEIDINEEYTCTNTNESNVSRAILDRVTIGPNIPGGHIETLMHFIDRTDHRAIFARLPIPTLLHNQWKTLSTIPRLVKPKGNDESFTILREILKQAITENPSWKGQIEEDGTWDDIYAKISKTFLEACTSTFERPPPFSPPRPHQPSKEERNDLHAIKLYQGSLSALNNNRWTAYYKSRDHIDKKLLNGIDLSDLDEIKIFITSKLKDTQKRNRDSRTTRLREAATKTYDQMVNIALTTGSAKKLSPSQAVRIPPIVIDPDHPTTIIYEPEKYIKAWRKHFSNILTHDEPPEDDKPWMDTASSANFRREARTDPFPWPIAMTVDDLKLVLARGNRTPSPGPDDWEKWALRRSGDEWLSMITNLVNYVIEENYFPLELKENYIIPIYKQKGDTIDPNNYRGIILANTLQTIAASWFNIQLMSYVWKMKMIPDTQIAAQTGSRVSDMTQFLNALDGFTRFTNQYVLALKRDQKKSFDKVHHSGFVDVVKFFGLPQSVLKFDKARTRRVQIMVRCREMVSRPIITIGQTKQGDHFSQLKFVLTTAMASWWMSDKHQNIGLTLRTPLSYSTKKNHTTVDDSSLVINNVAATDDTLLLANTPGQLQILTYDMERFQSAYGMETEWDKPDKTTIFILGRSSHDPPVTINLLLPGGRQVHLETTTERYFLRTPINDPGTQGDIIKNAVRSFVFPRPGKALPLTAIRRIAHVTLGNKILARLQLHPIWDNAINDINTLLNLKIQKYYSDAFASNHAILFTTISKGGIGFPDIRRMNAIWSVAAVHRSLNSNNPTLNKAFSIMHSTFQCFGKRSHRCYAPFAPPQVVYAGDNGPKMNNFIAWEIPRQIMIGLGMQFIPARRINVGKFREHNTRANNDDIIARKFALPGQNTSFFPPRLGNLAVRNERILWATDGSSDAVTDFREKRSAFAVEGPWRYSASMDDRHATIQDAEVTAIMMAVSMDTNLRKHFKLPDTYKSIIYSDHLSTIRRFSSSTRDSTVVIGSQESSRHALRWLQRQLRLNPHISLQFQKAHTDETTVPATMNRAADLAAKAARNSTIRFKIPEENADAYSLYSLRIGLSHETVNELIARTWDDVQDGRSPGVFDKLKDDVMGEPIKRTGNVYEYQDRFLFTTAKSGFTAKTQLYARSDQLSTEARKIERSFRNVNPTCMLCNEPAVTADESHVFLHCPAIAPFILEAAQRIQDRVTSSNFSTAAIRRGHNQLSIVMYHDHPLWINNISTYWRGELPANFVHYSSANRTLYEYISAENSKLAARIWGRQTAAHA